MIDAKVDEEIEEGNDKPTVDYFEKQINFDITYTETKNKFMKEIQLTVYVLLRQMVNGMNLSESV